MNTGIICSAFMARSFFYDLLFEPESLFRPNIISFGVLFIIGLISALIIVNIEDYPHPTTTEGKILFVIVFPLILSGGFNLILLLFGNLLAGALSGAAWTVFLLIILFFVFLMLL